MEEKRLLCRLVTRSGFVPLARRGEGKLQLIAKYQEKNRTNSLRERRMRMNAYICRGL